MHRGGHTRASMRHRYASARTSVCAYDKLADSLYGTYSYCRCLYRWRNRRNNNLFGITYQGTDIYSFLVYTSAVRRKSHISARGRNLNRTARIMGACGDHNWRRYCGSHWNACECTDRGYGVPNFARKRQFH